MSLAPGANHWELHTCDIALGIQKPFLTSVIHLRCSLGSASGHGATLSCHACTILRTACDKLNFNLLSYLKRIFSFSCLLSWFVRSRVVRASVTHLPACEPIVCFCDRLAGLAPCPFFGSWGFSSWPKRLLVQDIQDACPPRVLGSYGEFKSSSFFPATLICKICKIAFFLS